MSWLRKLYFNVLYYRNPPWDTRITPPELLEYIAEHPAGRALDLGCGTGTNVITLAKHGWEVTGIDYAGRAIKLATKKAAQANVSVNLITGDATRLEGVSGIFDLVLDIGCFHSLEEEEKNGYIRNLLSLTAEGSNYLMYGFFKDLNGRGPGLIETDLARFSPSFELKNRQDGEDGSGRLSVWLTYQKKSPIAKQIGLDV
jgi:SAM-dependent methyltransferase